MKIENIIYLIPDCVFILGLFFLLNAIWILFWTKPLVIRRFHYCFIQYIPLLIVFFFHVMPNIDQFSALKQYILLIYVVVTVLIIFSLMPKHSVLIVGVRFTEYRRLILSILKDHHVSFTLHSDHTIQLNEAHHILHIKGRIGSIYNSVRTLPLSWFTRRYLTEAPSYVYQGTEVGFLSADQLNDFIYEELKYRITTQRRRVPISVLNRNVYRSLTLMTGAVFMQWVLIPFVMK